MSQAPTTVLSCGLKKSLLSGITFATWSMTEKDSFKVWMHFKSQFFNSMRMAILKYAFSVSGNYSLLMAIFRSARALKILSLTPCHLNEILPRATVTG